MNFILCYKLTPDPSGIEVNADGTLNMARAEWVVGDFEYTAETAVVNLAKECGANVKGLTVGDEHVSVSKVQKAVLARGLNELLVVKDASYVDMDSFQTAAILAKALEGQGEYDLVVTGEGSGDLYFQQVGMQLGELLGVPTVNGISKLTKVEDGVLYAERTIGHTVEVLEIPLPAVISTRGDIAAAKIPTMKDILGAGRKPVKTIGKADIGETANATETISVLAPKNVERKNQAIAGTPEEMADGLISILANNYLL